MLDNEKRLNIELNNLIRAVHEKGGQIYLADKRNRDFSVKLTDEVEIMYFIPLEIDGERSDT